MDRINLGSATLLLRLANRHGLITGSTGTGKSCSVQHLAESFSAAGVPVLLTDVKGDLTGISTVRPTRHWSVFGEDGLPMRTTVQDLGPLLMSQLLGLNQTQAGVMNIVFEVAKRGVRKQLYGIDGTSRDYLLGLDDIRAVMAECLDHVEDLRQPMGNMTNASIGAISRGLLTLEAQGGNFLFNEPALDVLDLMEVRDETGVVSILDATNLMDCPATYGVLMVSILTKLFSVLSEAGDLDKPKFVIIIDEAHLLFAEARKNKPLMALIERTVRLIRSKGVGVYFATQNPLDVPDQVLAQLNNRIQHGLRAFTPRDQRAVRAAAETFRQNPEVNAAQAITELGIGEALVSCLGASGIPEMVRRTRVPLPSGHIGPVDIRPIVNSDPMREKYRETLNREAAIARLASRMEAA